MRKKQFWDLMINPITGFKVYQSNYENVDKKILKERSAKYRENKRLKKQQTIKN